MAKETVGEYLKKERELRQITLEEISEGTKISVARLKLIEENRFDDLPAEVFVRGFIRNYAEYIGIDPEEAILRLEEDLEGEEKQIPAAQEIPDSKFHIEPKKKSSPFYWLLLAILIILISGGVYYYFFSEKSSQNVLSPSVNVTSSLNDKQGRIRGSNNKINKTPDILLEEEVKESSPNNSDNANLTKDTVKSSNK